MTRRSDALAVELESVSKRYVKLDEQPMLLKSMLPFSRPKRSELWAVKDVDLQIAKGETIGMLGRNGAGKSSLLRLLAGVSEPTSGILTVRGRIAPLISVGVGFHREMSGRENVLVNGMLLGLSHEEVADRFDDIVAFAELADFIDTPVKFYSSGMFMRLGFSVAIHAQPDVLLVDEVLAVGDLAFQFKCFDRMRELQAQGTTVVIVSHSVTAIQLLCPRAIVMHRGSLAFDGPAMEAVAHHYELLSGQDGEAGADAPNVTFLSRRLVSDGEETTTLRQHRPVRLEARIRLAEPVDSPQLAFTVTSSTGATAYQLMPTFGTDHGSFEAGQEIDLAIDWVCRLAGGTYSLQMKLTDRDGRRTLHQDPVGTMVYVEPRLGSLGIAELEGVAYVAGVDVTDYSRMMLDATERPGGR